MDLRNVRILPQHYTASQPTRPGIEINQLDAQLTDQSTCPPTKQSLWHKILYNVLQVRVTPAWRVLGLRMEETASRYGG